MPYNLIISVKAIEKWICFVMILSTWLYFFHVKWGSGSIVSVRWVHLDNPSLWECGNGWECNIQTESTLPHQSDYKIYFYDLMWPSFLDPTLFLCPACLYLGSQWLFVQVRLCRSFGEHFWRFPIRLLWSTYTCLFITIWMPSSPQRLFVCPLLNSYSRMFCDTEHNKLAQAPETTLMSFHKRNAHFDNETQGILVPLYLSDDNGVYITVSSPIHFSLLHSWLPCDVLVYSLNWNCPNLIERSRTLSFSFFLSCVCVPLADRKSVV